MDDLEARRKSGRAHGKRAVPHRTKYSEETRIQRIKHLEQYGYSLNQVREMRLDPRTLRGNIESLIGAVEIPVGVAGPLLVNGTNEASESYAPIATTEGALVSSLNRGCVALQLSGGVTARTLKQRMVRAPVFDCESLTKAMLLKSWIQRRQSEIQFKVRQFSNHADLIQLEFRIIPPALHVRFVFQTGDASGQNMTTVCTWNACDWIMKEVAKEHPGLIRHFMIDGNLSTDKKFSAISAIEGRGHEVIAEAFLPDSVLRRILNTTAADMTRFLGQGQVTGILTGLAGLNINVANTIAGIFTATGQDIACVHESSAAQLYFEQREGGLYASILLPNLVIGTVGGGVSLAIQRQFLEMMECYGPGRSSRLAELIASFSLALELSTGAALASGDFTSAHDRLGRNRSMHWLQKEDITATFMSHLLESTVGPIVQVTPMAQETVGGSLIIDLTSKITKRPCGLWSFQVQPAASEEIKKVFLKVKVSDHDLLMAFEIMAGMSSPGLGELLRENRDHNPFNHFHIRELKLAEMPDAPLRAIMPHTLGTLINQKRDAYILAQEFLEDIELLNCADKRDLWTGPHVKAAITQIAAVHGHFLGKTQNLEMHAWMFVVSSEKVKKMSEINLELARNFHRQNYDWFNDDDFSFHEKNIQALPTLWKQMEQMPRTLCHNDFNPRNLGFRNQDGKMKLVAYDWELATVQIPQRDVVEFLAFTLATDFTKEELLRAIHFHMEEVQKHTDIQLESSAWISGCKIALLDFLLQRLPMYGIAQSFRKLKFIEPAYRTARRMHVTLSQKEI